MQDNQDKRSGSASKCAFCAHSIVVWFRFKPSDGVICIAATNFPQSLDKALIRPGRFDRHVTVPNPDVKGRKEILEVHFKNVPAGKDVDLKVRTFTLCAQVTMSA